MLNGFLQSVDRDMSAPSIRDLFFFFITETQQTEADLEISEMQEPSDIVRGCYQLQLRNHPMEYRLYLRDTLGDLPCHQ